jgi:putative FmdB family regulatory protein
MPTYDFACSSCETRYTKILKMSERDTPVPCPECGEVGQRVPSLPQFILVGDGWAGKNLRVKQQMAEKNKRLDAKQNEQMRDTKIGGRLVPNVDGEKVDSWGEAQKLAKSKGKSGESYNALVEKETLSKGK